MSAFLWAVIEEPRDGFPQGVALFPAKIQALRFLSELGAMRTTEASRFVSSGGNMHFYLRKGIVH